MRNQAIKLLLLFPLFFLAGRKSEAQQVHTLTVQDALDLAKKNNLQVKNALLSLQIQEQSNKATTARALPTISGTAGTTVFFQTPVTIVPGEFFGGTPGSTIAVSFQPKYTASGGVSLNQTLFDGQVFVGLKARQTSVDYYQKAVDLSIEAVSVNIYKVYYQLVVSKTQIQQLDANIERADKLLHDTKIMHDNGFQEQLDVDKATVQLANLETTKLSTQTSITNGYLSLKYLTGLPSADSIVLADQFNESDLNKDLVLDTTHRYEDRFDFQSLQINKQLSDYNIRAYKALYYPTVSLTGAFQKNAYNNTYDFFSKTGNWYTTSYAGLNINVPIFSGFSHNANLKVARLQAIQTQNQLENLKLSIDNEICQARNNFNAALQTVGNQKKNTSLAESVYNQTKKKYESGLASNTDITNAQTDLITAQTNYINALYNAVIARVDYLKAIGKI